MPIKPAWFVHFPHCSEVILPCWSWFRRTNATSNCGFILLDGLKLDRKNTISWQRQLVSAMGCKVKELNSTLPPDGRSLAGLSNEDGDKNDDSSGVQHVPNLQLIRPRYGHRMYLERPDDAHALRRLVIPDSAIAAERRSHGTPLSIGLIQRRRSRTIVNLDEIYETLRNALPDANVTKTYLESPNLKDQALWFATKDVIVAAHGAALTNAIFITPGTIILQIYPEKYFFQSLDPLIEQSGGVALDWYHGNEPVWDWLQSKKQGEQNRRRESSIKPNVEEIVDKILFALGKKMMTKNDQKPWRE